MKVRVCFELDLPNGNDFDFNEIVQWVRFELGEGFIPANSELSELDFEPEQIDVSLY